MKILFRLLTIFMVSLIYSDCLEIENQIECEAVGCEWNGSDNMPGGGYCSGDVDDDEGGEDEDEDDMRCEDIDGQIECEAVGCEWNGSDNMPGGGYCSGDVDDDEGGALNNDADLAYNLLKNYPNPFNPQTTINFSVANPGIITLKVYDISGKEVSNVINGFYAIGNYSVKWNAMDINGNQLPSGIYIYQLNDGKSILSNRMVLLR